MVTIGTVRNYKIEVRRNDHSPPHFHIKSPNWAVMVLIDGLKIIQGPETPETRKAVKEAAKRIDEIKAKWEEFHGQEG